MSRRQHSTEPEEENLRQREKQVPSPKARKEAHVVGAQRWHEMRDRGGQGSHNDGLWGGDGLMQCGSTEGLQLRVQHVQQDENVGCYVE